MKDINLSTERYLVFLKRQKKRIAEGLKIKCEDSDAIGDKYTHCSWGACSRDKEAWPDPSDHLWPDQFIKEGRVAPKYIKKEDRCPFDTRVGNKYDKDSLEPLQGCFWYCKIFQAPHKNPLPTKEETLQLYDKAIKICSDMLLKL